MHLWRRLLPSSTIIERNTSEAPLIGLRDRKQFTLLGDFCISVLSSVIALFIWSWTDHGHLTPSWVYQHGYWIIIFTTLWLSSLFLAGNYVSPYAFHKDYLLRNLILATICFLFLYMTIYFFSPRTLLPRLVVLVFIGTVSVLTGVWREIWYSWLQNHAVKRPVILVGTPPSREALKELITILEKAHYQILGLISQPKDDPPIDKKRTKDESPAVSLLGEINQLDKFIKKKNPAELIILNSQLPHPIAEALVRSHVAGIPVTPVTEIFEFLTGRIPLEWLENDWIHTIPLNHYGTSVLYQVIKRFMDILGAALGLILFLPILPLLAVAIRIDSPGPVFYRQKRVGQGGKIFTIWKLRTMRHDAEASGTPQWAKENDPRITRVGKWLRKFRLDEFPQFWNILKGDMSAVGPRPERPEFESMITEYIPLYPLRHAIKPGMAGWAMVHFEYVDSLEDAKRRLEYDLFYIKHQSLWLDILIILQAMIELILHRGR